MAKPIVYGSPLSTFVRATRMTLAEKGVDYDLVDVGVLDGACHAPEHLARQPFGKVPAFEHDGFTIYETAATTRYIDAAFDGPRLTPSAPKDEAQMSQVIAIQDHYGYEAMVIDTVAYFFFPDFIGGQDDDRLKRGKECTETCLSEFERLMGDRSYLASDDVSLADLYVVPAYFYLSMTPAADELLGPHKALAGWWDRMSSRDSVTATVPDLG